MRTDLAGGQTHKIVYERGDTYFDDPLRRRKIRIDRCNEEVIDTNVFLWGGERLSETS